ncbi:hypothetical protein BJX66DRAFT_135324 [Aspergillus keveii]|uniref:Uncharacterized protein n=1 Tax=Aspergillus keveii TaxID=714993 RepID=A0ABR4GCW0_9EURO
MLGKLVGCPGTLKARIVGGGSRVRAPRGRTWSRILHPRLLLFLWRISHLSSSSPVNSDRCTTCIKTSYARWTSGLISEGLHGTM